MCRLWLFIISIMSPIHSHRIIPSPMSWNNQSSAYYSIAKFHWSKLWYCVALAVLFVVAIIPLHPLGFQGLLLWHCINALPIYHYCNFLNPFHWKKIHLNYNFQHDQFLSLRSQILKVLNVFRHVYIYRVGPKKAHTFESPISRKLFKLSEWKSNQIKVHSILFQMMYGFVAIRAIEMVEMAFRKKSILQKTCRIHATFQSS